MSQKANPFKIGIFIIVAIIIALLAVIFLGGGTFFQKKVLIETYFEESVHGLDIGSPVKFRGFRIGKIDKIALVGSMYLTEHRYIMAQASLFPDNISMKTGEVVESTVINEVNKGLRARLGFQGLTGTPHLELDYVDTKSYLPLKIDWEPRHVYIPSVPSTITRVSVAVDRIMKSLEKINFEGLSEDLKKSLNGMSRAMESINLQGMAEDLKKSLNVLSKTLEDLDARKISDQAVALLAEVRETNRNIDQLLKEPEIKSFLTDASVSMARTRRIVEKSEEPLNQLMGSLKNASESIKALSHRVDSLSKDVPQSLSHLKRTLRRLDNITSGQQQNIQEAMENIRLITENIREITDNAKKYPSQVLFGTPPSPPETGDKR